MLKTVKALLIILFISTFSLQANSETSWITKKDKTKKTLVKKTETESKKNEWIKKKKKEEIKKNKEKFKEKINESKSWITKKSKEKIKDIKENLKKYKDIDSLPKAEFYFAAIVEPKENEEPTYLYGYVNSDTKSKKFELNNISYYSKSDGIGFLDDGKTTCEVDSQTGDFFGDLMGKVVVKCLNKIKMTGKFIIDDDSAKGIEGVTNIGNNVEFEFFQTKKGAITQLALYKSIIKNTVLTSLTPDVGAEVELKPTGKYYALVIGNSKYTKWASLKSPVNDVIEIKNVLEKQYNFEKVIPVINGTRKDIFKAITELTKITTDKDYVLIYYSGHGDIRSTQSYWIPVDGAKDFDPTEWINIRDIEVYLENEISAHHLVVMVDSCYFAVASKGNTKVDSKKKTIAYSKLLDRRARIILSSGSNEPVEDSVNKHSKFASSFIQSLKNNENTIRLSEITENIFIDHAGSRQQPYHARVMAWGHGGGDFIFIKK